MKYFALLSLVMMTYQASAVEWTETIIKKEFNRCLRETSMEYYKKEAVECERHTDSQSQEACEEEADVRTEEWVSSPLGKIQCEHLMPTVYQPKEGQFAGRDLLGPDGAKIAFMDGEYELSAKLFRECLAVGDSECAYGLATMHLDGLGVELSVDKAVQLLKLAAESCNLNSMPMFADLLFNGKYIENDSVQALEYYLTARALGSRDISMLETIKNTLERSEIAIAERAAQSRLKTGDCLDVAEKQQIMSAFQ